MTSTPSKGISRITWDLRKETTSPVRINKPKPGRYSSADVGFLVTPGTYSVEVVSLKGDVIKNVVSKTNFNVVGLNNQTLIATNTEELDRFRAEVAETQRGINGASKMIGETEDKLKLYNHVIKTYPNVDLTLLSEVKAIDSILEECKLMLWGDGLKSSHEFETAPSISGRIGIVEYQLSTNTTGVTNTQRTNKAVAEEAYTEFRILLDSAIVKLKALEDKLAKSNIPYIKGKDENWKED